MHLPKKQTGFTLIELLVVIAIIAILVTIGAIVYSGVQRTARDSRRKADVQSLAKSLEAHYNSQANANCTASGATYCPIAINWFSAGSVPADPNGGGISTYCMWSSAASAVIAAPGAWTSTCPSVNVGATSTAGVAPAVGLPAAGTTNWQICASLETVAGGVFCLNNQQQ